MDYIKTTIGGQLRHNADQYSDEPAVVYCESQTRWSWAQLDNMVEEVALGLIAIGAKKGTHIAIWGTNVPEWLLTQFAAARIGAILVTINPEWKGSELQYALDQSDSNILVMIEGFQKQSKSKTYHYDYLAIVNDLCPELETSNSQKPLQIKSLPQLRHIVVVNEKQMPGKISWLEMLKLGTTFPIDSLSKKEKEIVAQDTAMIQYTSGTTGFPKGTMLTHFNILNNAKAAASFMQLTAHDRLCGPVPYYHCFGSILVNLCCLVTGATMVIPAQHFNAHMTLESIQNEKCTALHGVPTMFIEQLEDQDFTLFDLSSLRTGIIAGAPVEMELMEAIAHKMGARNMTIGYGLTEASPITHQTHPEDPWEKRAMTVGKPTPETDSKIVDVNSLEELAVGQVGEIWVKGYHVMKGYYNKPEETEKAIVDGWLRTGDLGKVDEEGYYHIVGRLKELILVGGHNVYPAEVEQALHTLLADKIEMLQVVGVPHPKLQEVVAMVVKCQPGVQLTLEEVRLACEGKMEWPKIPRHLSMVKDFSPFMTVTGKIQKFKITEFLIKELQLSTITS